MFIIQMEKERSPLLSELMMYLRELMKDYKNEVKGENEPFSRHTQFDTSAANSFSKHLNEKINCF